MKIVKKIFSNQARAILTGALTGAQVGLDGIPKRFIEGLREGEQLLSLAQQLAKHAAEDTA